MNNVTYKHPNKHPNKSARKKKMITFQTLRHTIDTRREEGIPLQGYGSLLPQHTADKDMRILTTTAHSSFGGRDADDDEKRDVDVPNTRGLSSANTPAAGLSYVSTSLL